MAEQSQLKKEVGYVVKSQDYLLYLEGLPNAQINDLVLTKNGGRALVHALTPTQVEAMMLDRERPKPGECLEKSGIGLGLPAGNMLLGRCINPLGIPLDGGPSLPVSESFLDPDAVAPGIDKREVIKKQFYTGQVIIDTLLPIGMGQRELILCEPRSGKEDFFIDIIAAQKGRGVVCIYAGVGRSELEVKRFFEELKRVGADSYSIIIAATSAETAPMIVITPLITFSLAEHFRNQGKTVLLIVDDFATHAKYSREISLLAGRVPGRESYPADIFYQHSGQMERAGMFNQQLAGGSITLLPVVETNIENFTNLIPTNVMSITDGHILLSASLRAQGIFPAVEWERSVTRVGRQTQMFIHKVLADKVRSLLTEYRELERYARFGSELSTETQLKIKRGKITEELLKQELLTPLSAEGQIMLLSLVFTGFMDKREIEEIHMSKPKLIGHLAQKSPFKEIASTIKDRTFEELQSVLTDSMSLLEEVWPQSHN